MKDNSCDENIFNGLFRKYSEDLSKFLYHKFGSMYNPSDMVQEAFMALWKNCQKVKPESAKSYLFTVANNMSLKQIRKSKTEDKYRSQLDGDSFYQSPEESLEEKEFSERFQHVLNQLSEKQRIAFMLSKSEGLKHKEIAEMLGISQKAVEKRIYTAADFIFKKLGKKI